MKMKMKIEIYFVGGWNILKIFSLALEKKSVDMASPQLARQPINTSHFTWQYGRYWEDASFGVCVCLFLYPYSQFPGLSVLKTGDISRPHTVFTKSHHCKALSLSLKPEAPCFTQP